MPKAPFSDIICVFESKRAFRGIRKMKGIISRIVRFFTPEGMIGKTKQIGELDSTSKVYKTFLALAWPAMAESLLTALTGFVDTAMVGTLGDAAIAAVGLTNQPRLLFWSFFTTLNLGVLAVVARKKGEGDREAANDTLHKGLVICAALAVVIYGVSCFFAEPLLRFAGAEADVLPYSVEYYRIIMLGLCIYSFGLCINAAQRGTSNTRVAFLSSATLNIVNVILNYLLIGGRFGFSAIGTRGAAIATLCGNIAGLLVAVLSLFKKRGYLRLDLRRCFGGYGKILRPVWKVSSGAAAEQLVIRIGFFAFAKIVADLGTESFAAHQIGMNIISLSFACGDGLGVAASALVGQNLGRERPDMAMVYGKAGQRVGFFFSAVLFFCFMVFPDQIIGVFTDTPHVVSLTRGIMYFIALTSITQISQVIFSGCLRGAGDTKFMAVASLISIALIRPTLCYFFCFTCGLDVVGAWVALFIDQSMRCAFSSVRFIGGKWMSIKLT